MTKEEFYVEMQDVLQTDADLNENTVLADLYEWDSMAMMATMAFLEKKFGKNISTSEVRAFSTVGDVAGAAGVQ